MNLFIPPNFSSFSNVVKKQYLLKLKVIKHLYISGPTSVLEICRELAASSPTVMQILNELLKEDQIEKYGQGESIGGRKPDLFRLRDKTLYVLSIHMEKFRVRMVIADSNHNHVSEIKTFPIEISKDLSSLDEIYKKAHKLIENSDIDVSKLAAVGVSMPGLISGYGGENYTYFLPKKESESITTILQRKFNKPVYIQNDAKATTLAERYFGQAQNKKEVLVLSVDWGIGLGMMMDYSLRSGISGFAGEFGHIPTEDDGLLCHCGKRGCLETIASGAALARMVRDGLKDGQHSILNQKSPEEMKTLETQQIIEAANLGDQFAIEMLFKVGFNLGKGLSILIQLFNPELIIIGGKIAAAGQYITTPVQQSINTYCMTQLREKTKITLSELGKNAGLKGGLAIVMENLFLDLFEVAPKTRNTRREINIGQLLNALNRY